jgi:multiple sugar transport system substrate-binding protein
MSRRFSLLFALFAFSALFLLACAPAATTAPTTAPAATSAPAATTGAPPAAATPTTAAPAATTAPANTPAASVPGGTILFHSSQFSPVNEAELMRNTILKDFTGKVDFQPQAAGPFVDIPLAQQKANKMQIDVIGGQHGDFPAFVNAGMMDDLTPLLTKLASRGFPQAYVTLGKMGSDKQYYIPWAQATYIMVANKKALQYLPAGVDINAITYDQVSAWAAAIQKGTGQRMLGFPMGPTGLIHRFWQGYLYPSFTGTEVTNFKSADAVAAWTFFKSMWPYVNPASINYNAMSDPLKAGEVWLAWDHVARLSDALNSSPNDYVAFPAPAGPKGRTYMPVVLGLGIPKGGPNRAGAEALIDYLTQPKTQGLVAQNLAFFPVVNGASGGGLPAGIQMEADAVTKMNASKDAFPALLPTGLGTRGGDWNKAYNDTFQRIVMKNEDIQTVLNDQAKVIQGILTDTKAPCWAPDPVGDGPCQVK